MNLRKWLSLFFVTLLIGGVAALIVNVIVQWSHLGGQNAGQMAGFIITSFIMGLLFSGLSQMGFFAYLTVHRIGLGIFKSHSLWSKVQLLLILVTFFDLGYIRYVVFSDGKSVWSYWIIPVVLLAASLFVAEWKKRETNKYAFVPTLFLMYTVTVLEWIPALKQNGDYVWVMGITLFICNTYQVMKLHRLTAENTTKP